jgi:nucleoside-diphosphate-sugar epimerase
MQDIGSIVVTGGAGYVGAVLVPKLLREGYEVKVIDLYIYGEDVLDSVKDNPRLTQIKGDIRHLDLMQREIQGTDAIIHLACISNDPSYDLDPELGKSINYDAFVSLVDMAKRSRVKRFIYASSSSVYGIKDEPEVTEDLPLEPLTDYSKYKCKCEEVLLQAGTDDFVVTVIRPSTVCGYSPRMRLDLTVNILTNHAMNKGEITVFGGEQKRPNIHIQDMTDLYVSLLKQPDSKIRGQIFNAGYQNCTVREIADIVAQTLGNGTNIRVTPTNDLRSYHVCSERIKEVLGYEAVRTLEDAVLELKEAFESGKIPDPLEDIRYYNIKTMQSVKLK